MKFIKKNPYQEIVYSKQTIYFKIFILTETKYKNTVYYFKK